MASPQHPQLIIPDNLIDGTTGDSKPGQAVLIQNDRNLAIGETDTIRKDCPPDTIEVPLPGTTLCPGLIDGHTHLSLAGDGGSYDEMFSETDEMMVMIGAMNMVKHLNAGVTTIREHGARNRVGFSLKEGLQRGYLPGPRMLVSGRPITCTGGHFHVCNETADGEDEIRKSVRRLAPVHEAHHFDRTTAAHCRAKESMRRAVQAGIDLMEHAEFLDPDNEMRFDPQIAEMMEESGIWISPTLQAWTKYPRIAKITNQRESGTLSPEGKSELQALETRAEIRLDVMRKLLEYNVKDRVIPGTDSGVGILSFGHLDYDLDLLVQVGFTPAEAIVSATQRSAEAIGLANEIGTIEKGKVADLVAFNGDPSKDIKNISNVATVFQSGIKIR